MSSPPISPAEALLRLKDIQRCATVLAHGPNIDHATFHKVLGAKTSDELQARLNMSNAVIRDPNLFACPLNKDQHITGKVGGKTPKRRGLLAAGVPSWERPSRAKNEPNFIYPASRPGRHIDSAGGRSFHFAETLVHRKGPTSRSHSKARQNYLTEVSKVPLVEEERTRLGIERGVYLFRQEASANTESIRLALTNMGRSNDEVAQSWQVVAATEERRVGKTIEPHISIDKSIAPDDAFWGRVRENDDAPEPLKAFLADDGATAISFWGDDFRATEVFLRQNGWHDRKKGKKRNDIRFHRGRNVILQRRLVLEIPSDLGVQQIERLLTQMAKEFSDRNLPFVMVVHRPDEHND